MFPTADTEDISQSTSQKRSSSPSRDERDSSEPTQVAKPNNNREITFNMLLKEMVFCIALALTTYGALHNTPTKISKHPQAVRFFSADSPVTDWYKGQLSNALLYINNADVAFVMYYAPWDAESQYVKQEFEKAATIMGDRVHFSAINCWNPGSECRLQHSKIPSWPILMAYTINSRGVLYKGPREAHHMVRFLELIIEPVEKISTTEELVTVLAICDVTAVAFIPMAPTSKYYNTWYQVALKMKEFDVHGEFCFTIVTSEEVSKGIGATHFPSVRLMLWNDTKEYRIQEECQREWNDTSIMTWLLENYETSVARVVPMWKKAYSFEKFVDGNPILILFTPLNPLFVQIPNYMLLREVAMEYYMTCRNNGSSERMKEQSLQWTNEKIGIVKVERYFYQKRGYEKFCEDSKQRLKPQKPKYNKKDVVFMNNKWRNTTQKHKKGAALNSLVEKGLNPPKILEGAEDKSDILGTVGVVQECDTKTLPAEKSVYDNLDQCQTDDENDESDLDPAFLNMATFYSKETSMLPLEDDPLAAEGLVHDRIRHLCKVYNYAKQWGPPIFPATVDEKNLTHNFGLSCKMNFSLNMIAVDSVENHHFAEALGIDIKNMKDMTAVVILDTKHETQYVMKEEYSAKSIRDFIRNFHYKKLKRSLRTHVEDAQHTHYFGSAGPTDQMELNESTIQVTDLTTKTFRKFVRSPGKVSIVAVCGGSCGAHTSRSLTEAVLLLKTCGVPAMAARIDALRHDLPWHYTATSYPTILVFSTRKDGSEPDSRAYPVNARISASGLVALALRSLGTPQHLRVRLALCSRAQSTAEKKTCLRDLKEQIDTIVGRNLKYWRQTADKELKDAFIKRLQYLHQVSLDMSLLDITDLHDNSSKQIFTISSLNTLTKNWDINVGVLKNLSRLR